VLASSSAGPGFNPQLRTVSREVMGSILSQGQCHTKDVMKMVPCLALNIEKGNTGSQELR